MQYSDHLEDLPAFEPIRRRFKHAPPRIDRAKPLHKRPWQCDIAREWVQ